MSWHSWFNVSGGAAALRSPVTAIARNPNHLDLFVTGTDGRIYSTWWDASSGWANWFNVSGGRAALGSKVTALARNPDHLDLFVTGTDAHRGGNRALCLAGIQAERARQAADHIRRQQLHDV